MEIIILLIMKGADLNSTNILVKPRGSEFKLYKRSLCEFAIFVISLGAQLHEDEKKKFQEEHINCLASIAIEKDQVEEHRDIVQKL